MMCGTVPSAPGTPIIMISHSSSLIYFYWNEPFDNGGTSITSYKINILKESDGSVITQNIINSNKFQFSTSLGLIAGQAYDIKVSASNFITQYFGLTPPGVA